MIDRNAERTLLRRALELWVQSTLERGGLWAAVLQLLTQTERARQAEDTASLPQRDTGPGRNARRACSHYSPASALTWGHPNRPDWQRFGFGVPTWLREWPGRHAGKGGSPKPSSFCLSQELIQFLWKVRVTAQSHLFAADILDTADVGPFQSAALTHFRGTPGCLCP